MTGKKESHRSPDCIDRHIRQYAPGVGYVCIGVCPVYVFGRIPTTPPYPVQYRCLPLLFHPNPQIKYIPCSVLNRFHKVRGPACPLISKLKCPFPATVGLCCWLATSQSYFLGTQKKPRYILIFASTVARSCACGKFILEGFYS